MHWINHGRAHDADRARADALMVCVQVFPSPGLVRARNATVKAERLRDVRTGMNGCVDENGNVKVEAFDQSGALNSDCA